MKSIIVSINGKRYSLFYHAGDTVHIDWKDDNEIASIDKPIEPITHGCEPHNFQSTQPTVDPSQQWITRIFCTKCGEARII